MEKVIPIFFATDDRYIPFLDVALRSLRDHISAEYFYKIIILNTGLKKKNTKQILKLCKDNFSVEFVDISAAMGELKEKLPKVFHFGLAAYYRLFIEKLFPQFTKILYLDCDIIVNANVAELYNTDLGDYWLGGVADAYVETTPEFCFYTEQAVGVKRDSYINSGILVIDLEKFRKNNVEDTFLALVNKYNFETVDPDQAYINYICRGKIKFLQRCWNRQAAEFINCPEPKIIHFALYRKPWQYDNVYLSEFFWKYARKSSFYKEILKVKNNFTLADKNAKELAGVMIRTECLRIALLDKTFRKVGHVR